MWRCGGKRVQSLILEFIRKLKCRILIKHNPGAEFSPLSWRPISGIQLFFSFRPGLVSVTHCQFPFSTRCKIIIFNLSHLDMMFLKIYLSLHLIYFFFLGCMYWYKWLFFINMNASYVRHFAYKCSAYQRLLEKKDLLNYFVVEMSFTIPIQNFNKTGLFLYVIPKKKIKKWIFSSHDFCYL